MAKRAEFVFTIKESAEGTPWIAAEPMSETMPSLRGLIGFDLAAGTTLETAKEIVGKKHCDLASFRELGWERF